MNETIRKSTEIEDLCPVVLHVNYQDMLKNPSIKKGVRSPERYAYDYEIEFFTSSSGTTIVDGTEYKISKGDLVFRRPGQRCNSITPYSCWFLVLDLLGTTEKSIDNFQTTKFIKFQHNIKNHYIDSIPTFMKVENESDYMECFSNINMLARSNYDLDKLSLKIKVLELIYMICKDAQNKVSGYSFRQPETLNTTAIFNAIQYIKIHYAKKITLEELSQYVNLSPIYFHRLFKKITNNTPAIYIQQVRLDRAKHMLQRSSLTCSEISGACGFNSPSYFNHVFKKNFKVTPLEYRLKYTKTDHKINQN